MSYAMPMRLSQSMRDCVAACTSCHQTCLETIQHCLHMGGLHAAPAHIRLMEDCVQICQTSADFMFRQSPLHKLTCNACSAICRECAEDCRKLGDDEPMRICADACEGCAALCQKMSA